MQLVLHTVFSAILLTIALSLDAFVASFAYGNKNIKIPNKSAIILNAVCALFFCLALLLGGSIKHYLSPTSTNMICFLILLCLGVVKLLDSVIQSLINRKLQKQLIFSMFQIEFILKLYANPIVADVDESATISPIESISLGIALSLDGIAVGFGAALGDFSFGLLLILSIVFNFLAIFLGGRLGHVLAQKIPFNLSWISGALLVMLAVLRLA